MTGVRPWRTTLFVVALALVLLAQAAVVAPELWLTRLWEDEAYNLTVPINLVHGLGYTSDGMLTLSGLPTPFDVRISTGPTVLLPVAAVLATGIDVVVGSRLVMLLFYAGLLVGLWFLGRRIAGRWGGLVAIAVPLALNTNQLPSPAQGPLDVLGEFPAAMFLVFALLAVRRRPWLAGLLVGLAVQTKFIALLALPALVLMAWFAERTSWPVRLRRVVVLCLLAAIPTLLYELAILLSLGWAGFVSNTREFVSFLRTGGQDVAYESRLGKVAYVAHSWFVPWWAVAIVALLVLVVGVAAVLVLRRAPRRGEPGSDAVCRADLVRAAGCGVPLRELGVLLGGTGVLLVFWIGWWLTSTRTETWIRYPAPALLVGVPVFAAATLLGCRLLAAAARRAGLRAAVLSAGAVTAAVAAIAVGLHVPSAYVPNYEETLPQQRAAAARIATLHASRLASPWGTQLGAIVLAHARMVPLYSPDRGDDPLVYAYFGWAAPTVLDRLAKDTGSCGGTLLRTGFYLVCSPPKG